jgi:hypothetical protein
MHPGDNGDTAHGNGESDELRETDDLAAETGDVPAPTVPPATDSTPTIRPAVTDDTVPVDTMPADTTPVLPTITASPLKIPPTKPPPVLPGRRIAAVALVILVGVLLAGALIGRATAPRTPVLAAPSTAPSTVVATVPPIPPSQLSVPAVPARPADALATWAARVGSAVGVPVVALQAYGYAQLVLQGARPDCHLGWTTLAGVGEVASHHGQAGGAVLDRGGRSSPAIIGPLLDGQDGRALVADTDAGAFDADASYDRRMGPMMLLPAAWRAFGSDGDDDQIQDPYDIDDASLGVARLLCSGGEDLNQIDGWTAALARLQQGQEYTRAVFQAADGYGRLSREIQ